MNIQKALNEIKSSGLSDAEIGKLIGAHQSVINRLRRGSHKSCSYERGLKIKALHESRIKEPAA